MLHIATGSRWQKGYAASFHVRPRDELSNAEEFTEVREVGALAAAWRNGYNHLRAHSLLVRGRPAPVVR